MQKKYLQLSLHLENNEKATSDRLLSVVKQHVELVSLEADAEDEASKNIRKLKFDLAKKWMKKHSLI